ncbi:hypothetical protein MYO4S_00150 [Serratia phage 4S]|nr:hypothetical protein MYO4S_00150 [Serratia phage 4S]
MFNEGRTYKFSSKTQFNTFQCQSPVAVNRKIAAFIGDSIFTVIEMRQDEVIKIRIQGVDYTLVDIVGNYGYILDKGEFCYFVEASPEDEKPKAETQGQVRKGKFCVFATMPGTVGFLVRNTPDTYENAVAFGEKWVKDNPGADVIIAEGLLRMSAEEQVVVNKSEF